MSFCFSISKRYIDISYQIPAISSGPVLERLKCHFSSDYFLLGANLSALAKYYQRPVLVFGTLGSSLLCREILVPSIIQRICLWPEALIHSGKFESPSRYIFICKLPSVNRRMFETEMFASIIMLQHMLAYVTFLFKVGKKARKLNLNGIASNARYKISYFWLPYV